MINKDKLYHFIGGCIIAVIIGLLTFPIIGLYAGVAIGAVKEVYDSKYPEIHTTDANDFIATVVGVLLGYVTII